MECITERFETPNGPVEGIIVKWSGFSLLLVTGNKGFLACPAIDIQACQRYGKATAIVESSADNPIGTLQRFCDRKVTKANDLARKLGITEGMIARDAYVFIA
ncbi:MAG: DUF1805 domain-containing protein [Sedimentisphaerales bacterium]|nr:DUF1805 domain-containing protein [Sedimentisphaerales bacterium]